MIALKTRQILIFVLMAVVLLIGSWLSLVCIKEAGRINFQVSGFSNPWMADINPASIKHPTVMENDISGIDRSQLIPVSNSPLALPMNSVDFAGININGSKNLVVNVIGSSGKIQIKIMFQDFSTLNVNALGFSKISLPFVQDIGLTFNGNGKFNLNPFGSEKSNYRIYGLGNINFKGNLLAVSLDISESLHNRIRGIGKVSAFINPDTFERFLLRK